MRDAITKAIDYYIERNEVSGASVLLFFNVKAHNRIRRHDPYRAGSS